MKTLFHGWPVMVHDMHMRRRRLGLVLPRWGICIHLQEVVFVIILLIFNYTPCPHKKGATDIFTITYKYARIFMIFGTQLCKWILIILMNLLRCVPCTSLTWWHNVDVTEIMPFTVHVTLSRTWHCHHAAERDARFYPSRDVATKFTRLESGGLQHLGYLSRDGLPFTDPWCEGVERTSAERVEAAGPHHHRGSDCTVV